MNSRKRGSKMKKNLVSILTFMLVTISMICISVVWVFGYSVSGNKLNTNYELSGNGAEDIYAVAEAQLGKKYPEFSGFHYRAWCADFVSACAVAANVSDVIPGNASVANLRRSIVNAGGTEYSKLKVQQGQYTPVRGDIIIFLSNGDSHVGIVDKMVNGRIYYIDGNNTTYGNGNNASVHYSNRLSSYAGFTCIIKPKYKKNFNGPSGYNISLSATRVYNSEQPVLTINSLSGEKITNYTVYVKFDDGRVEESNWGGINSKAILTKNMVGTIEFWAKVSNEGGSYEGASGNGSLTLQVQKADLGSIQNLGEDFYAVIKNENGSVVDYTVSKDSDVKGWSENEGTNQRWRFIRQSDGSYKILSQYNEGKALDVSGGSNYQGTNVQVYEDNNSDAQRWFLYSAGNGYYYFRPKCSDSAVLDLNKGQSANGTNIQIWTTNQDGAQKWKIEKKVKAPSGYNISLSTSRTYNSEQPVLTITPFSGEKITNYTVYVKFSDGRVEESNWEGTNSKAILTKNMIGVVEFWAKVSNESGSYEGSSGNGSLTLQVQKANLGSIQNLGEDFYAVIKNENGSVADYTVNQDTNVKGWAENGANTQIWRFVRQSDGSYKVLSKYDERNALDVSNGSNYQGANVQVCEDNNSDAQRWFVYSAGNDYYYLKPKCSDSAVLDLNKGQSANGTNIQIWTTNQDGAQKWKVEKIQTEFTVQYNANGGSGAPNSQTKQVGKTLTIAREIPKRVGYEFRGWSTSAESQNVAYISGGSYTEDAAKTLYAVWSVAKTIEISQNVNVDIMGAGRMYKFIPQESGTYCFESTGSIDTKAVLYNTGGVVLTTNDDGGSGRNFLIEYLLNKGETYYLEVLLYNSEATGMFGMNVSRKISIADMSGVSIGGSAKDALRINWNKNTTAQGYILEQYSNGVWKRIARIEGNTIITYRVENLKAETIYQFRIKGFAFDGNNAVYGNYQTISGKTDVESLNLDSLSGVEIGGRAVDALRINWNKNADASGYIIEQYDNGSWKRVVRIGSGSITTYRVEGLKGGTSYQFRIKAFGFRGTEAVYGKNISVSGKTNPAVVTELKIGGTAKDALRLNWSAASGAEGYIIEKYEGTSWKRIVRLEGGNTKTYRIEGLKTGTSYQFRIKTFCFDGSTVIYSDYKEITGKTDVESLNLDSLNGVKIGGRAVDALRINWNKNADASGYIIEQYNNGSWKRIVRIGSGSTTTYRVEGLKGGTNYQFRIKAFGFRGAEAVYGKYIYVNGKTNPEAVMELRIGGTAEDALRLNWGMVSGAEGYIIEKYEGNSWKRIARLEGKNIGTYRVEGLKAGTSYQFRIKVFGFDGGTVTYSDYKEISGKTDISTVIVENVTGVKIGGRADNALRLNWNKSTRASGYIIEQNQNGTWTRIARIGENNTTTYRVEQLTAGKTYQFRICIFAFQGNTPIYGNFSYINGTTVPSMVNGLYIGGTAADALRLNWNKNTSASGYIIEKYQNGNWVRVARIADNNMQTYRVEGLQSQTAYVFRICTFGFDGETALYSDYQMITGKTK